MPQPQSIKVRTVNFNTFFIDKLAIGISSLCLAHCLVFPVLATLAPGFLALGLNSESFHLWMVISVIPTSIFALALGCKKHAQISVFIIGMLGLGCLLAALIPVEGFPGEAGEKLLTLCGALMIALAHFKNYKLCQHQGTCMCLNENN